MVDAKVLFMWVKNEKQKTTEQQEIKQCQIDWATEKSTCRKLLAPFASFIRKQIKLGNQLAP